MFGDGIYLAEDMGKSDQYCAPLPPSTASALRTGKQRGLFGTKRNLSASDAALRDALYPDKALFV